MIIRSRAPILILLLACMTAGCQTTLTPDPFGYLGDPVARAVGMRWWWEPSQHFDAGVILRRERRTNLARDKGSADLRMAFDMNNNPVQIGGAAINGVLLSWIPTEQGLFHAQIYARDNDTNGYGAADSATFSYAGYDGESWTTTVGVTPDFGDIISPDTVTISQGWTIRYKTAVPGDSIRIHINVIFVDPAQAKKLPFDSIYLDEMLPDTGTIVIPPANLPHAQGISSYVLQVSRFHFIERTSPRGKRIGIYSEEDFPIFDYSAKP